MLRSRPSNKEPIYTPSVDSVLLLTSSSFLAKIGSDSLSWENNPTSRKPQIQIVFCKRASVVLPAWFLLWNYIQWARTSVPIINDSLFSEYMVNDRFRNPSSLNLLSWSPSTGSNLRMLISSWISQWTATQSTLVSCLIPWDLEFKPYFCKKRKKLGPESC